MSEQFANLASTTLASPYTAGSGSISVASASGWPTSGTFSVTVRDQNTKAIKLLFRVTSVSGTTFSGASEGTDASANAGDLVDGTMLTVAALTQLKTDAAGPTVDLSTRRPTLTAPVSANFSWVNQATATEYHDAYGFSLQLPNQGNNNLTERVTALPASTYTFICGFRGLTTNNNFNQCGPCLRDSAQGKAIVFRFKNDGSYDIFSWIEPANFQTQYTTGTLGLSIWGADLIMTKIVQDATHRTFYVGLLRGALRGMWFQLFQQAANTFITENQAGVFCLASNTLDQQMDVDHFTLSTP